jgi:tungstate transport system permease protein
VSVSDLWAIFDTEGLWRIILLSLGVSLSATALAALFGAPLGAALAACPFPGRRILVVAANAFLGLPPVVVGLALYLLLSRSGPLGALGLLFTPGAMVVAQTVLALPIVTALVHAASADLWAEYGAALQVDGANRLRAVPHLLAMARLQLVTAVLAGFGRTVSEVGAILIVGGNIAGYTRTMTTAIVLETSKGNLTLALGLGLLLIGISIASVPRSLPTVPEEDGGGEKEARRGDADRFPPYSPAERTAPTRRSRSPRRPRSRIRVCGPHPARIHQEDRHLGARPRPGYRPSAGDGGARRRRSGPGARSGSRGRVHRPRPWHRSPADRLERFHRGLSARGAGICRRRP